MISFSVNFILIASCPFRKPQSFSVDRALSPPVPLTTSNLWSHLFRQLHAPNHHCPNCYVMTGVPAERCLRFQQDRLLFFLFSSRHNSLWCVQSFDNSDTKSSSMHTFRSCPHSIYSLSSYFEAHRVANSPLLSSLAGSSVLKRSSDPKSSPNAIWTVHRYQSAIERTMISVCVNIQQYLDRCLDMDLCCLPWP